MDGKMYERSQSILIWHCWYFLLICVPVRSQLVSQSLVRLSNTGYQFSPIEPSVQLISTSSFVSLQECFHACHVNNLCHVYDYNAIVSQQCRLFEGDLDTLGTIIPSTMVNAIVGVVLLTPSLFVQYGSPCSSGCMPTRYLVCGSSSRCVCTPHTYWNPSVSMCLEQSPVRGALCDQTMAMCRMDLGYTCLQFNQCGPLALLEGTTIADNTTVVEGSSSVGFRFPFGVSLYGTDDNQSLIIADQKRNDISVIQSINSNHMNTFLLIPQNWSSGGRFYLPSATFVDVWNEYDLYVSDSGNNRILMFKSMKFIDPPQTVVAGLPGASGSIPSNQLQGPMGLVCDNLGNLFVADYYNHRIMQWTPNATNGTMIAGTGTPGNSSMELAKPFAVFVDIYRSLLYVVDSENHRIQVFKLNDSIPYNGTTVAGGNGQGHASNQLNEPSGIWVSNRSENLYIVDSTNNRIQRWNKGATSGVTIAGNPSGIPGSNSTMFNNPNGIIVNDKETRMYITDSNNMRIQAFELI